MTELIVVNKCMLLKYIVLEKFDIGNKSDLFIITGHSESTFWIQWNSTICIFFVWILKTSSHFVKFYYRLFGLDTPGLCNQKMVKAKLEVKNE